MATSITFNTNTLQLREFFALSFCKCFTSNLLHNSHLFNHFSSFSSSKRSITTNFSSFYSVKPSKTVINPVNRSISAVFCSLNCDSSAEGVEFRNNGENSSGYSLFYSNCEVLKGNVSEGVKNERKNRKNGGKINFGETNYKSFEFVKEKFGKEVVDDGKRSENGAKIDFGRRNEMGNDISSSSDRDLVSYSNYEIVREKFSKDVVDDGKGRKNGAKINLGRRNKMGNGISSSSDKRVGFDKRWRWENNNVDSGWSRENGCELFGETGRKFDFGENNEMGNGNSLSKSSGGKGMRRMERVSSSVAKENENRGQKGSRVFPKRREDDKSVSSVIKDDKSDDDVKVKRKERLSKKKKVESPQFQLKVGLDMCSKTGDVMGAISLYDSGVKQGVKMGQHHYTVLLYLCSSAAMGVIQPAKSGSGSRVSDTVGLNDSEDEEEEEEEEEDGDTDYLDDEGQVERFEMNEIRVSDDVKKYALEKGFEVYERMCLNKVPTNEAALTSVARMAMAMGDGDMAFDMVKQMKSMGISPKLRSYIPALSVFSTSGELEKAFAVEKHMLENGVHPEEPELEALLRVSIESEKADKVYYVLHKLRTNVRSVSPSTAKLIEKWFRSRVASRVGKRKWDANMLARKIENVGGGWHGQGWLGSGKWTVARTSVGADGLCKCCREKLALIDLDPEGTDRFAESVASIAIKRDKNSSFQKFQRWLDYYGPFEVVVDAANVGLYKQRKFKPSKVNAVVNGIRQLLPSKKWPLIVLHHKRVTGSNMGQPVDRAVIDRWRNADALYATPTGSNDDWYWLYAAIKFKCFLVTNDEMRDHTFQLLGNDFFPKWKERHQVRFNFSEIGPVFHMPPPCSVVIQESERGFWHIPIASEHQSEGDRTWLCISRPKVLVTQREFNVGSDPVEDNPPA
ncbi:hypothetical protein RND81_06G159100 [Saponaria officinalis]|uniref:ribonuclease P n=1 Tax=Saponaria officinalis TaxID=3572 RepID=A0AAW1KBV8_SAPOF